MNKFKFKSAVFIAAIMLSACEKKENSPNNNEFTKSTIKHTNKGMETDLEEDLAVFITEIYDESIPVEQEPVRGLLFVESALNYFMNANFEEESAANQKYFEATLDIGDFQGSNVSGADLADFYNQVYTSIGAVMDTA